jgi:hypothetical protein
LNRTNPILLSRFLAGCTLLTLTSLSSVALAANVPNGFKLAGQLLPTPEKIEFTNAGIGFSKEKWTRETEGADTELFTAKGHVAGRVAVLKNKEGQTESLTAFTLTPATAGKKGAPLEEQASSLFFNKDELAAYSSCEDRVAGPAVGRVCVTATPKLCHAMKDGSGVTPEILTELDSFEMRGLAVLLTLRGSEHQLDNVVRTGNRLGLKTALQTTKGQIIALAQQIEIETANSKEAKAGKVASVQRDPAAMKIVVSAKEDEQKANNEMAREVLERSLPRLKQACLDTKFN